MVGIFLCLFAVSLIGIDAWRSWQARSVQIHLSKTATANLARAMAQHADDTVKQVDISILGIIECLRDEQKDADAVTLVRLHEFMGTQLRHLPQVQDFFVIDEHGKWVGNSHSNENKKFDSSQREYFIYHRDHTDPEAHIGPPIRSLATGKWVLTISRRMDHSDGSFGGVVLAGIDAEYFKTYYDKIDIGKNGAILIAMNDGTIFVRRPSLDESALKSINKMPFFIDFLSKIDNGSEVTKSTLDGVQRIVSHRRLQRYSMFVAVALSMEDVLESWTQDNYYHIAADFFIISILAFLGYRLVLQVKLREQAEEAANDARTSVEKLNQTLQKFAFQDGLTGLANRRYFDITLEKELNRAARMKKPLGLIMLDVDFFKKYNDQYGHPAGDDCLKKISAVIKTAENRPGDMAARYGGEEMVIILPNSNLMGTMAIAEKIVKSVRELSIPHQGNGNGVVTISAGVAVLDPVTTIDTALGLVTQADQALYMAKSSGRDRTCSAPL